MTDNAGNNGSDYTQVQVIGEARVIVVSQGNSFIKFKHSILQADADCCGAQIMHSDLYLY